MHSQAFKKRQAQKYCTSEVRHQTERPTAPLELHDRVAPEHVPQEAELAGVSLVVAGGKAAPRSDAEMVAEWQGQGKVEPGCRLVNQRCLVAPVFLKTPRRMAALGFLIMVGVLVAGRSERQVRRVLAALQHPITGLRPAGRATVPPTVARLCKAFADSSLGQVQDAWGRVVEIRLARLHPVPVQSLQVLGLPQPAELFAQPVRG